MKAHMRPKINAEFMMALSEEEARALVNITKWSTASLVDAMLRIGGDDKERLRVGLTSLLDSTGSLATQLRVYDEARAVLAGTHKAVPVET